MAKSIKPKDRESVFKRPAKFKSEKEFRQSNEKKQSEAVERLITNRRSK